MHILGSIFVFILAIIGTILAPFGFHWDNLETEKEDSGFFAYVKGIGLAIILMFCLVLLMR